VFKFPAQFQMTLAFICSVLLGLCIVLTTFYLCLELGLRRALCIGIPLLVILSPEYILFENFLFYAYATAALTILAAMFLLRLLLAVNWWWGVDLVMCRVGLCCSY